jgi:hypothetical protein
MKIGGMRQKGPRNLHCAMPVTLKNGKKAGPDRWCEDQDQPIRSLLTHPTKVLLSEHLISVESKQRPGENGKNLRSHHFLAPSLGTLLELWGIYSPTLLFLISINSPPLHFEKINKR